MHLLKKHFIFILCMLPFLAWGGSPRLIFKIQGVNAELQQNIQHRFAVETNELSHQQVPAFFEKAPTYIKESIEPYGYFKPLISSHLNRQGDTYIAAFYITPGPRLMITSIHLSVTGPGQNNKAIQDYLKKFPIKSGKPFSTKKYETAKKDFLQTAFNQGYIQADYSKKEIRILSPLSAIITLQLATGEQFYFGKTTFEKTPYADSFIKRFTLFKSGAPFSEEAVLKAQNDLTNSYFFQEAIITPHPNQAEERHIPLTVATTTAKAKKYNLGLGYGTLTGVRFTAGTEIRRVNDLGHYFTAQLRLSRILSGLAAKYFIPGYNPLTDLFAFGLNFQKFQPKNGTSQSQSLNASYTKHVHEWKYGAIINYLNENYQVSGQTAEHSSLLYPTLNLGFVKADDLVNPSWGESLNLTLEGASKQIISATDFLQAELAGKYILSPTKLSRLVFRGDFGYTITNNLTKIPLSLRYFAGGMNSIRGYADSSIGPGRYLEVASIELQHAIYQNFSAAIFYDLGTATNHFGQPLSSSTGLGVIYNSVVGPIKAYVSHPLTQSSHNISFDLSIGPEFS